LKTETKCIKKVYRIRTYLQRLLKAKRDWKQGASLVATSFHPAKQITAHKNWKDTLGPTETTAQQLAAI
jgi:hypothetical protein